MLSKPGIRAKLIVILLFASALPLTLGILSFAFFGSRVHLNNQGSLFQAAAASRAQSLGAMANIQVEKLVDWTALSRLDRVVVRTLSARQRGGVAAAVEKRWAVLPGSDPLLRSILENDLSVELRQFQKLNPLFRELLVTDADGLLIAATNKTSDYVQSDEEWWRFGSHLLEGQVWLDGISHDNSARVYSLDATLPIRDGKGLTVGVLKGVLNASAMFASSPRIYRDNVGAREVVMGDGQILARLNDPSYEAYSTRIDPKVIDRINAQRGHTESGGGWFLESYDMQNPSRTDMVGYAPLALEGSKLEGISVRGLKPMYLIVHENSEKVFAPIRTQLWLLCAGGIFVTLLFLLLGLNIAQRYVIDPLRVLSTASRSLAECAGYDAETPEHRAHADAQTAVEKCLKISTRDEIEQLARDFALMGDRVLRYHEHLQREIALKTGEIQRDLDMAREFQEALLPRNYPLVPEDSHNGEGLRLQFHHVYRPAMSVGGDFFDVFKLSEHQAGIFIADVMGHGARSALVTAILRTLLQDLSSKQNSPSEILQQINQHFYTIMQGSRQFVFVSAFCLVIDARYRIATYASAGHPSPLLAQSSTGLVYSLLDSNLIGNDGRETGHTNAALGLAYDSTYFCYSRAVSPGDSFLLYTDGIVEAPNPTGEEFGISRLMDAASAHLRQHRDSQDVSGLSTTVVEVVDEWMQGVPSPDDICLVVVGADDIDQKAYTQIRAPGSEHEGYPSGAALQ